jgi:hypothetical protein
VVPNKEMGNTISGEISRKNTNPIQSKPKKFNLENLIKFCNMKKTNLVYIFGNSLVSYQLLI